MVASRGIYAPRSTAPLAVKLDLNSIPEPNSGCLLWLGRADDLGYGRVSIPGGRQVATHRAAYELANGPIPAGLKVCHKCDVPSCINPAHLFVGTHADNMGDMARKGRARWGGARGSNNGNAVLTEERARMIFAAHGSHGAVAERFGVSQSTVSRIKAREYWAHATVSA